jgi:hypothetical protein
MVFVDEYKENHKYLFPYLYKEHLKNLKEIKTEEKIGLIMVLETPENWHSYFLFL